MENKAHALAAGTFLIVVTTLLVILGLWLARDETQYRVFEMTTRENVSGLQPQATVRYKGVAVGRVVQIGFDAEQPGNVLIRMAVSAEAPITETTYAELGYQGVTGLAFVLLGDADYPLPALPEGSNGVPRLPLHPSQLSEFIDQGPVIMGQIKDATARANDLLAPTNQQLLMQAVNEIGGAANQMGQLAQRLDATVNQRLDPALAQLPALAKQTQATLQTLQQAGASATQITQSLGQTLERMNAPDGALTHISQGTQALVQASQDLADQLAHATLPRVQRAADETGRAARQMGRLANSVSDNPQGLLYGHGPIPAGPGEPGFVAPAPAH